MQRNYFQKNYTKETTNSTLPESGTWPLYYGDSARDIASQYRYSARARRLCLSLVPTVLKTHRAAGGKRFAVMSVLS